MRKSIFLSLFFVAGSTCFGQELKLVNLNSLDQNSRTIFIGMENNFRVVSDSVESIEENESATFRDGVITLRPFKTGKIIVNLTRSNQNIAIEFEAKAIPAPKITVSDNNDSRVKKDLLSAESHLRLMDHSGSDRFFDQFQVVSFRATLGDRTFEVTGNKFSSELLASISEEREVKVLINSVKATSPSGYSIEAGINQALVFF